MSIRCRRKMHVFFLIAILSIGCQREPASGIDTSPRNLASDPDSSSSTTQHVNNVPQSNFYRQARLLAIGIDDYASSSTILPLQNAESDARQISSCLQQHYGFTSELLLGKEATRTAITSKLNEYDEILGKNDVLIFYFAGHGLVFDEKASTQQGPLIRRFGYLIPYDAKVDLDAPHAVGSHTWNLEAFNMQQLVDRINRMKSQHVLIVIDACSSGFMTKRGVGSSLSLFNLLADTSRTVIAATSQQQEALDGIFTSKIVAALQRFSREESVFSTTDLFQKVRTQTAQSSQSRMTPQMNHVGSGDGELLFFPSSIDVATINQVKQEVSQISTNKTTNNNLFSISPMKGFLERHQERVARQTTVEDLLLVTTASNYWHGDDAENLSRQWSQTRQRFIENASFGDPYAVAALHFCYSRGIGENQPTPDFDQAFRWAVEARKFHKPAGLHEFLLGRCYRSGIGVQKNSRTAERLYGVSASAGSPFGKLGVATLIFERHHSAAEETKAIQYLQEASEAGIAEASLTLAKIYAGQIKTSLAADSHKMVEYAEKATRDGHKEAGLLLYAVYGSGLDGDIPIDRERAAKNLRDVSKSGFPGAQFLLACELGHLPDVPNRLQLKQDFAQAQTWLDLSAAQSYPPALNLLARGYVHGNVLDIKKDFSKARQLLDRAIELGDARAMAFKANYLFDHQGVYRTDYEAALQLARQSATLGDQYGCSTLGKFLEWGIGMFPDDPKNPNRMLPSTHEGLHWHVQAISKGGTDEISPKQLKQFRRNLNQVKFTGSWNEGGPSPEIVLRRFHKEYPDSAKLFEKWYP